MTRKHPLINTDILPAYNWPELDKAARARILKRPAAERDEQVVGTVKEIIARVKEQGDNALRYYTRLFDHAEPEEFVYTVPTQREKPTDNDARLNQEAAGSNQEDSTHNRTSSTFRENLDPNICNAIKKAHANIKLFHQQQGLSDYTIETAPGVICHRRVLPLDTVGLYVPGGTAPLISTILMLATPARLAGCPNIILCTPCDDKGGLNPYMVYAADLCGIPCLYKLGGAQAIAAMSYGTQTIPKCDKIFGPGNKYVTEAKMQVSADPDGPAIDLPAGPSEVCILADDTSPPDFIAADLLSQAEHDIHAQVFLISTCDRLITSVRTALSRMLETLPRADIARRSLATSAAVTTHSLETALEIANAYAPEHLIICTQHAENFVSLIRNAGSVFTGIWTPEAAGDYASGTNHVLPTYGYARSCSGLTVESFQKTMTVQHITPMGLPSIGKTVETLAELEGLHAHGMAVRLRMESLEKTK